MLALTLGPAETARLFVELRAELELEDAPSEAPELDGLRRVCEAIVARELGLPSVLARSMALRIRSHQVLSALAY